MNKTTKICFTITGEIVQKTSRELMMEDKWEQALNLIKDSLVGISIEQSISVLNGENQLTGDSNIGVNLIPEEPSQELEEYKENLIKHYAGRVKLPKSDLWFVPYAVIRCVMERDIGGPSIWKQREILLRPDKFNDGFRHGIVHDRSDWAYQRAMYYANNPMSDRAYSFNRKNESGMYTVLFKVCPSRPFWMKSIKGAEEALNEFLDNGLYLHKIPEEVFVQDDDGKIIPKSVFDDHHVNYNKEDSKDNTDLLESLVPPELKHISSDIIKGVTGSHDDSSPVEVDTSFQMMSGYILRNGDFYGCGYMAHPYLARRILIHVFNENLDSDKGKEIDTEKEADKRGWVRVQRSATKDIAFHKTNKLAQSQINTLFEFVKKHCHITTEFQSFIENDRMGLMILCPKTEDSE